MKHFQLAEFDCKETQENKMTARFLTAIDELREICDFPFTINSGYRSPLHSKESVKERPGMHSYGIACDVRVADGVQRLSVVKNALAMGFTGIGVAKTFIHVDLRETQPVMWVY